MATETTAPETPAADERVREVGLVSRVMARPELGAVVGTVLVWLFFAVVAFDNNFVSWTTTASILNRAAPLGILSIGVTLLMIAGEFDLSVGSVVGFSSMAIMVLVTPAAGGGFGWALWPALVLALLLSLAVGAFNGALVVTTKLPSFIITLGGLFVFRGLAIALSRLFTNRTQLGGLADVSGFGVAETLFAQKITLFGANFRISILWWIGLSILVSWILLRTSFGNWVFGTGGAPEAARNLGVPVVRVRMILFMTTAFMAFMVAMIQAVQFTGADALRGTLQELQAITVAVVGGTLLTGGYGSIIGALFGAVIFAMVQQGIVITGVQGDWFQVFVGGVLVLAVIFNNYIRQRVVSA